MDGLECSEVLLSATSIDNEKSRLDSDFFQKKYIAAYNKMKSINHTTIRDELSVLTDFHANGSYESIAAVFKLLDTPDYAYMVRTTDLEARNYNRDVKYVSKRAYDFLEKSKVYGGEVIINKIGSPGRTFLMPHLNRPVSLGMNQFMLRMKSDGKIDNILLYVFLNSSIGKLLIDRKINGTVPLTIDKKAVRSIYIPCLSSTFRSIIRQIVELSDKKFADSNNLYTDAQSFLLDELSFDISRISTASITKKSLSVSLAISGRLDAEYYQPKYECYEELLHTKDTVASSCNIYDGNFLPDAKEKYRYIELANVGIQGNVSALELQDGDELPSRARRRVKAGQVIVSSIEGSLQSCALITDELDGAICSTGFYVVDSDKINSETLLVLFKSEPIQALMKQRCSGTILTAISKGEFLSMPLPEIDAAIQNEIAQKVQQSFALRRQAEKLIGIAVRAVEIAIEEDETVAMAWLEKQTSETSMENK